jgi:putative transposase
MDPTGSSTSGSDLRAGNAHRRDVLGGVLRTYVSHYNQARPHRGLDLRTPIGNPSLAVGDLRATDVRRRDVLGGLIHEYSVAA